MTIYQIEYTGMIEIEADNELIAMDKFDMVPNEELGRLIHHSEILDNEDVD